MKKSRFTEQQIAFALRQAEGGTPVCEVCRKMGVSEQTFYRWKKQFAGMGVADHRLWNRTTHTTASSGLERRLHGAMAFSQ